MLWVYVRWVANHCQTCRQEAAQASAWSILYKIISLIHALVYEIISVVSISEKNIYFSNACSTFPLIHTSVTIFFCRFLTFVAYDVYSSPISLASVDTCGCTLDSRNCLVVYLVGMLNPGLNLCPQWIHRPSVPQSSAALPVRLIVLREAQWNVNSCLQQCCNNKCSGGHRVCVLVVHYYLTGLVTSCLGSFSFIMLLKES